MQEKGEIGRFGSLRPSGNAYVPIIALNLAVLAGVILMILFFLGRAREEVRELNLSDNGFLTTEWRLLRELKADTDRMLGEKDREIETLRKQYQSLKSAGSSTELLASIEVEMRRLEAERGQILANRINAAKEAPAAGAEPAIGSSPAAMPARAAAPAANPASTARPSPLIELLGRRVSGLEADLKESRQAATALGLALDELRREKAEESKKSAAPATAAAEPAPAMIAAPKARDASDIEIASIIAALEQERDSIEDPKNVIGLSDLKTGTLLRAIVRIPAIRAEYPELLESLDRYLKLIGTEEYLKGRREAYDEVIRAIEAAGG